MFITRPLPQILNALPGGEKPSGSNFIHDIIVRDVESNKFSGLRTNALSARAERLPDG
jgi:hypothetical protein